MALAPRKGRWALDSELTRREFQPAPLPADRKGVPSEMIAALEADLATVDKALADLEARKSALGARRGAEIAALLADLELSVTIDALKQTLASSGSVQKVTGWIPKRRLPGVLEGLESLVQGRLAARVFDPEELPEVKSGKVKVPVSTPHGRMVKSFERMVFSYSIPLYGTIDPDPFRRGDVRSPLRHHVR